MREPEEIFYYQQDIVSPCHSKGSSVEDASFSVTVASDGVTVSTQHLARGARSFGFAVRSGAAVVVTVTSGCKEACECDCVTREFVAPQELGPVEGTPLGSLSVVRKHVLAY